MGRAIDLFVTYRFIKLLTTPFEKTDAFKFGIIDEIIKAKPTDGLWGDDRTDEDQLGATYDELEWAMNYSDDPKKLLGRHKEVYYIYNKFHKQNKHKMVAIPVFKK